MTYYITNPLPRISRRAVQQLFEESMEQERSINFPVDVKSDDQAFEISAIIPGVSHDEIGITIVDGVITIEGNFPNHRDEDATYHLSERPYGSFKRSLNLNIALDAEGAEADLKDGILTLRVPKAKEALPRSIKVQSK